MCRFLSYSGPTTFMQELLLDSSYSLVNQSKHARMRFEPVNGDGFGVGWYPEHEDSVPGTFVSIEPAWSNRNLREIASKIPTSHFFAHVRDASSGMPVSQANCHPFQFGNYLWMHNGFIGDFNKCRRTLLNSLSDSAFNMIMGNTDSEHAFAIFLDELGLDNSGQDKAVDTNQLFDAVTRTITRIIKIRKDSGCLSEAHMNFAVSNGLSSIFTRFNNNSKTTAPTLYYLQKNNHAGDELIVASEPLSEEAHWQEVQHGEVLVLEKGKEMEIRKILV